MKRKFFFAGTVMFLLLFLLSGNDLFAQDHHGHKHGSKDSTEYSMGGMKIKKIGEDSVMVCFNHHDWDHSDMPGFPFWNKKNKFNGHWAGVELGWNGYVNSDFNSTLPDNYKFLDLNNSRSMMVNLNPFEFNLNLCKNHFGLTSGLGFEFNNYFFTDKNYYFSSDSAAIIAFRIYDAFGAKVNMNQSKMVISWLNVPILFEYQTNARMKMNSFHVSAGVIGGIRIGQYVKQDYPGINQPYTLKDEEGNVIGTFTPEKYKNRDHSQLHLNQFKLDATLRVGWSFLNLFASYSISPMFKKDQGPVLYPWNVGITLVGW